jgi:hypothetical protein
MAFTVATDVESSRLVITASGAAGLGELVGLAALTAEVAEHRGIRRVLLNLANVETGILFSERISFGVKAAGLFARLERSAVVLPPDYLDSPGAKAAQRSGLHVQTFLDLADATAWIDQPGE